MSQKKALKNHFQISAIEILESCLKPTSELIPDNSKFHFNVNLEHRMNIEKKLLFVVTSISIHLENPDHLLGQVKTSCIFIVPEIDAFFNKESKALMLPDELVLALNSVSISTTRGLMFSHFKGTSLHNAILPVINPGQLVQQAPG